MQEQLTGIIHEGDFKSEKYKNAVFHYFVHIPEGAKGKTDLGLLVNHDGLNTKEAYALEQLAKTGEAPWCITVGIVAGDLFPTIEDGHYRNLRMSTYDVFSADYPDFVVEELLPYVIQKYDLKISPSADMHLVSGGSSGGVSSWNVAWHREDYFKRVYMSSPSFLSMGKGDEMISLIRKFETKAIRVVTEYSEHEPNDYFGSSFCVADAAERALKFAGYDVKSAYYPGESHCSRNQDVDSAIERMKFLWANWKTEPITVKKLSPRMEQVITLDSKWSESSDAFPEKTAAISTGKFTAKGEYIAEETKVVFVDENGNRSVVADSFEQITSLAISSDKWRLYIGDKKRGCVYAATIEKDGSLSGVYLHGTLHLRTDFKHPGAFDLCVDQDDRVYVATEIGIQTIRSYGLIDVILSNPTKQTPEKIAIGNDGYLYVNVSRKVYRRKLNEKKPTQYETAIQPKYASYYD